MAISIQLGAILATLLVINIYFMGMVYLFNNEKKWNLFKIAQFAVLGFAIFATNSRGALLILTRI